MRRSVIFLAAGAALAGGCARTGDFDDSGGIRAVRSACPAVAVPAHVGDVTLFDPPASREARAIDVEATITNVRQSCESGADPIRVTVTFEVQARRRDAGPAREVVLPYFSTVLRGGTQIVSKDVGRVAVRFADGQARATTQGQASATVSLAAATLDAEVQKQITRRRKPGDADAALDPLADPTVRAAVQRASFELLVGFQLTEGQLAYNATR